jgi:beta-mannosidase
MSRTADLGPLRALAAAAVEVERDASWRITVRHAGGPAALGLVLEDGRPYEAPGWAVFGDNVLDLLPGEARTVDVLWRDAPQDRRAVVVSGWNVQERRVG